MSDRHDPPTRGHSLCKTVIQAALSLGSADNKAFFHVLLIYTVTTNAYKVTACIVY